MSFSPVRPISADKSVVTRDFRVPCPGGTYLHAVEMAPQNADASSPTVVAIQGTGGAAFGSHRWRLRLGHCLAAAGTRFILFDCRGHGYSDGEKINTTVTSIVEDASAVLHWATSRTDVSSSRIGLFGFSLGSAIAVLVAEHSATLVRSILAFKMTFDMASGFLWYFERFDRFSLDRIFDGTGRAWIRGLEDYVTESFFDDLTNHDIIQSISQIVTPLWVIQPKDDDQVPRWVTRKAYEAARTEKQFFLIDGSHTLLKPDGWDHEQEAMVHSIVTQWIDETL